MLLHILKFIKLHLEISFTNIITSELLLAQLLTVPLSLNPVTPTFVTFNHYFLINFYVIPPNNLKFI